MKLALGLMLLVFLSVPETAQACPNLSESETITESKTNQARAALMVKEIFREADYVFVGRVISATEVAVPISELVVPDSEGLVPAGNSVDGEAIVSAISWVKGRAEDPMVLRYSRDESRVEISCSGLAHFRTVSLQRSYRYLFYVRNGKVLRANQVVDWFEDLDAKTELGFLGHES